MFVISERMFEFIIRNTTVGRLIDMQRSVRFGNAVVSQKGLFPVLAMHFHIGPFWKCSRITEGLLPNTAEGNTAKGMLYIYLFLARPDPHYYFFFKIFFF
jgi:hypothetical protein